MNILWIITLSSNNTQRQPYPNPKSASFKFAPSMDSSFFFLPNKPITESHEFNLHKDLERELTPILIIFVIHNTIFVTAIFIKSYVIESKFIKFCSSYFVNAILVKSIFVKFSFVKSTLVKSIFVKFCSSYFVNAILVKSIFVKFCSSYFVTAIFVKFSFVKYIFAITRY